LIDANVGPVDSIHWHADEPELREPTLIAAFEGWGDAGDAASTAAGHIRDRLGGSTFASIDPEPFFDFSAVRPEVSLDGTQRSIHWPLIEFSSVVIPDAKHDLIVLIGVEPQLQWRSFIEQILHIIEKFDVKLVVSLGALIADVVHSRPAVIYSSGYDTELNERLDLEPSTYEGPTGIIGAFHDALGKNDMASISLWGAVPGYVPSAPSPKAALALVERVAQLLELTVPTAALEVGAAAYEHQISDLVAENEETQEYVARLEETYDTMAPETGTALIEDLEQYLKDR